MMLNKFEKYFGVFLIYYYLGFYTLYEYFYTQYFAEFPIKLFAFQYDYAIFFIVLVLLIREGKPSLTSLMVTVYSVIMLVIIYANMVFDNSLFDHHRHYVRSAIYLLIFYFIGNKVYQHGLEGYYKNFLYLFIIIAGVLVFCEMFVYERLGSLRSYMHIGNSYLAVGDSFLIISILATSAIKENINKIILMCLGVLILVLLYNRTAFIAYAVSSATLISMWLLSVDLKKIPIVIIGLVLVFASANFILIQVTPYTDSLMTLRVFNWLETYEQDGSIQGRIEILDVGLNVIKENFIMGSMGWQVKKYHDVGNYIHNYLSVWAQFGIIPFLLFCVIIVKSYRDNMKYGSLYSMESLYLLTLTLMIVVSRSYGYPQIWLGFGMINGMLMHQRKIFKKMRLHNEQ